MHENTVWQCVNVTRSHWQVPCSTSRKRMLHQRFFWGRKQLNLHASKHVPTGYMRSESQLGPILRTWVSSATMAATAENDEPPCTRTSASVIATKSASTEVLYRRPVRADSKVTPGRSSRNSHPVGGNVDAVRQARERFERNPMCVGPLRRRAASTSQTEAMGLSEKRTWRAAISAAVRAAVSAAAKLL